MTAAQNTQWGKGKALLPEQKRQTEEEREKEQTYYRYEMHKIRTRKPKALSAAQQKTISNSTFVQTHRKICRQSTYLPRKNQQNCT